MPKFSKEVRDVLWGDPFGEVYPKREPPRSPVYDGRTAALRILKLYFQELTFYRPGGRDARTGEQNAPIAFQVPERDIHVEWPDDEEDLKLPALALLAQAPADYDAIGMTNYVQEETRDKYSPGTVLIWMSEAVEKFVVEVWAETKQQRRSIKAGMPATPIATWATTSSSPATGCKRWRRARSWTTSRRPSSGGRRAS